MKRFIKSFKDKKSYPMMKSGFFFESEIVVYCEFDIYNNKDLYECLVAMQKNCSKNLGYVEVMVWKFWGGRITSMVGIKLKV